MKYIIIGNGIAGIEAALTIRSHVEEGEITVLTESPYDLYYRPRLIEFIEKKITADTLIMYKEDFYRKKGITIVHNTVVSDINKDTQTITTGNNVTYTYDRLLLATGGTPIIPEIVGQPMEGIFTFRTIEDGEKITEHMAGAKHLVISGGGLLGIETAYALKDLVETVTIVEAAPLILQRQLDREASELVQSLLSEKGISFIVNDAINEVRGDQKLEQIILKSGKTIPADVLVHSIGIRPSVKLAQKAGLTVKGGIVVNDNMQTSEKHIYAAGDCCEHNGWVYGLWLIAKEQGMIAGMNMSGQEMPYRGSIPATLLKIKEINIFSAGDVHHNNAAVALKKQGDNYQKLIYDADVPLGSIIIGDKDAIRKAQSVMLGKSKVEELLNIFYFK